MATIIINTNVQNQDESNDDINDRQHRKAQLKITLTLKFLLKIQKRTKIHFPTA